MIDYASYEILFLVSPLECVELDVRLDVVWMWENVTCAIYLFVILHRKLLVLASVLMHGFIFTLMSLYWTFLTVLMAVILVFNNSFQWKIRGHLSDFQVVSGRHVPFGKVVVFSNSAFTMQSFSDNQERASTWVQHYRKLLKEIGQIFAFQCVRA